MKYLSEKQVLKKLGIDDFRHLSKKKIMKFFSMLPNMDPEVAKKALEQFPAYAGSISEVIKDYKDLLIKMLESDKEDSTRYYNICNSIIESIENELHKDNLSFEEKERLIDKMLYVQENIAEYHKERRNHALKIVLSTGAIVGSVILAITSAIGGASGSELPMIDADDTIP